MFNESSFLRESATCSDVVKGNHIILVISISSAACFHVLG